MYHIFVDFTTNLPLCIRQRCSSEKKEQEDQKRGLMIAVLARRAGDQCCQ